MILIHHLHVSQSERIIWLCEELGVPYEVRHHFRGPLGLAPPELKDIHPFGTAPVIEDGPVTLAESAAIIDYVIARYGGGKLAVGPDKEGFADYLFWYHFANGSVTPAALVDMVVVMLGGTGDHAVMDKFAARSDDAFAMIEQRLGQVKYLAGDNFTAADIIMNFTLKMLLKAPKRAGVPAPNIGAYLARIGMRRAYARAMAVATTVPE